jgi:Carboxypeptidase regulatory-like domain/TonB-dependent Receptor Plug Domain
MPCEVFCGVLPPDAPLRRRRAISLEFLEFCFRKLDGDKNPTLPGGLCMALRARTRLFCSPCARRAAIALSLAVVFAVFASAQNTNGRIIGTVTDTQGAAIGGAKIRITNTGTNVLSDTVTNDEGYYQVLQLPIGSYVVTVEHAGFAKSVTAATPLDINQSLRIDVHLRPGSVMETVQVAAEAAQVETVDATLGATVTGATIQNLPLNGRNTLDLALTQPGVMPIADDIGTYGTSNGGSNGNGGISVAGGRGDAVTYLLDGGLNNRTTSNQVVFNPNPEAIEEFRLLENNYTAEYGRNGGGTVTEVIKSGTNAIHGSLFDYLRNDAFNANDYINNSLGNPRPVLKRNQFGGTVGGPISIPKLVDGTDRFFFFFGYQGQRQTQTVNQGFVATYTPDQLIGNFSNFQGAGPDPGVVAFLQSHPYYQSDPTKQSQAIIDPTKIDPVAQKYIAAGLIPSSSNGQVFPQASQKDDLNQYLGKFDFYATRNDRIALTLGYNKEPIINPFFGANVTGFSAANTTWDYFGNIGYTKTLSAATLNELHVTAQRWYQSAIPSSHPPNLAQLGINVQSDDPFGPASLSFASGMTVGFDPNVHWKADNNYAISDTLSWNRGRHSFKFGGRFGIMQENTVYAYQTNGIFYFSGPFGIGSGNDLADFLFGASDEYDEYSKAPSNEHQKQYAVFAQDEWKASSRLTLTFGLRYEYTTPQTDTHGYSFSILPGAQSVRFPNAPLGFVVPGDPGAPRGWYFPDHRDLAPRFGFAWDPMGDARTSVRGGAGIFFDTLNGWMSDWATDEAPWAGGAAVVQDPTLSSNPLPPDGPGTILSHPYESAQAVDPFPSQIPPPSNIDFYAAGFLPRLGPGNNFVDIHLKTPYIYQYNLSVERQVANGLMAELGYAGSSSHNLLTWVDQNPMVLGTTNRILNQNQGLASNTYGFMPTFAGLNNANYNGLLASLTKRQTEVPILGNVFFTLAYTWSHNLDNGSGFNSRISSIPYYNHHQFYGNSDFDLRQRFTLSGGWELPFAKAWSNGPKRLTSGWSLYPIFFIQSGIPLDFTAGLRQHSGDPGPSGAGDGEVVRADQMVASVQTLNPRRVQTFTRSDTGQVVTGNFWFDPNSFQNDPCITVTGDCPIGFYGTYRRNSFHGPGRTNLDIALEKSTNLVGEKTKLLFRVEAFNIFNHAEFRPPSGSSIVSGTLGQITGTYDPRILQLALKLTF